MSHIHPTSPDYLLLDQIVRDLDGRLAGDLLPLQVVHKVDLEAVRFMAYHRTRQEHPDPRRGRAVSWMDGFTAGIAFQRAKEQG